MNLYPLTPDDKIPHKLSEMRLPCIPISASWFQFLSHSEALVLGCVILEVQPVIAQSLTNGTSDLYKKYTGDRPRIYPTSLGKMLNYSPNSIRTALESLQAHNLLVLDPQKQGYFVELNLEEILSLSLGRKPLPLPCPTPRHMKDSKPKHRKEDADRIFDALEKISPRQSGKRTMPTIYKMLKQGVIPDDVINCATYLASTEFVQQKMLPVTIQFVDKQLGTWIKAKRPLSAQDHLRNLEPNQDWLESL